MLTYADTSAPFDLSASFANNFQNFTFAASDLPFAKLMDLLSALAMEKAESFYLPDNPLSEVPVFTAAVARFYIIVMCTCCATFT